MKKGAAGMSIHPSSFILHPFPRHDSAFRVCRLGLASRGGMSLRVEDIEHALDRGVNFLNWCGTPDSLSRAIAHLGSRRRDVALCVQFEARTAADAKAELAAILRELRTDFVDVLTFY